MQSYPPICDIHNVITNTEGIQDIVEPKQQQQHPLSSRADVYSDHYNSSEPQPTSEQIYKKAVRVLNN